MSSRRDLIPVMTRPGTYGLPRRGFDLTAEGSKLNVERNIGVSLGLWLQD